MDLEDAFLDATEGAACSSMSGNADDFEESSLKKSSKQKRKQIKSREEKRNAVNTWQALQKDCKTGTVLKKFLLYNSTFSNSVIIINKLIN